MCFSATASFTVSVALGAAGIASLKKTSEPKQKLFAAIPLLFAVQQLAEGFVWVSFSGMDAPPWRHSVIAIFLVFALIVWPVWISLSVTLFEENKARKIIQYLALAGGVLFSAFSIYDMAMYPISAHIDNYHVYYDVDFPLKSNVFVPIVYVIATVVPLLVSSTPKIPVLGVILFVSYAITKYFFNDYVISVWCFFAALMSGLIYLMVTNRIQSFTKKSLHTS